MTEEQLAAIQAQLDFTELILPYQLGRSFEISARLSGVMYWIRFWWVERGEWGRWHIDFLDPSKDPIALGISLVPNHFLLRRVTDLRRPPGELVLTDIGQTGLDPGRLDLGKNYEFIYVTRKQI